MAQVLCRVLIALAGDDLVRAALRIAAGLVVVVALASVFAIVGVTALLAAAAGVRPGASPPRATPPAAVASAAPGASATGAAAVASLFLGTPYVWGGSTPTTGFDCSGLVQWSYGQVGIALPRTAQQQFGATGRIGRDELRPGDLVFFENTYYSPGEPITHVGIYVGDGQMINAPVEGKPVSVMPVFTGFWGAHYAGAGRPAGGRG